MESYKSGAHTRHDLKARIVWITKYRKPVMRGEVALRVREVIRPSRLLKKYLGKIRVKNLKKTTSTNAPCATFAIQAVCFDGLFRSSFLALGLFQQPASVVSDKFV